MSITITTEQYRQLHAAVRAGSTDPLAIGERIGLDHDTANGTAFRIFLCDAIEAFARLPDLTPALHNRILVGGR